MSNWQRINNMISSRDGLSLMHLFTQFALMTQSTQKLALGHSNDTGKHCLSLCGNKYQHAVTDSPVTFSCGYFQTVRHCNKIQSAVELSSSVRLLSGTRLVLIQIPLLEIQCPILPKVQSVHETVPQSDTT